MNPDAALLRQQAAFANALDRLLGRFAGGSIDGQTLFRESWGLIREAHAQAAYLGRVKAGDTRPFNAEDQGAGTRALRAEMEFLAGLIRDVQAGRYDRKSQGGEGARSRKARATLYALKLTGTANQAWAETVGEEDAGLEARWVLGVAEHCEGCLAEAAKGWRPLSEWTHFPGDGGTTCITNCKCAVQTRSGLAGFRNGGGGK